MRAAPRNPGRSRPHLRRGAALVDVIIGSILLAIGLATIISLTTRSLRSQTDGELQLIASWLADEKLNMVLVDGPVDFPKINDINGRCDYPFDDFDYDINIEDLGIGQPFRVTATVRWAGSGADRFVQVQAMIAERGGDPDQPRAPYEPVDREARWYDDEQKAQ